MTMSEKKDGEDSEKVRKRFGESSEKTQMNELTDTQKKIVELLCYDKQLSAKKIAEKYKSELENEHIEVYIFNADKSTKEDILASIKESDSILFGTSTKYGDLIGSIEDILKEAVKVGVATFKETLISILKILSISDINCDYILCKGINETSLGKWVELKSDLSKSIATN